MKKLITILFFSIFITTNANNVVKEATTTYSQVKHDVSSVVDSTVSGVKSAATSVVTGVGDAYSYTDTSSTFKEMYHDVKKAVVVLAEQFKTTTEQVLYIIGKKYFLDGIFNLVCLLILIIITIIILVKVSKFNPEDKSLWIPIVAFGIFFLGGDLVIMYYLLYDGIQYTFNPEYYVLQDIVNIVKSFK